MELPLNLRVHVCVESSASAIPHHISAILSLCLLVHLTEKKTGQKKKRKRKKRCECLFWRGGRLHGFPTEGGRGSAETERAQGNRAPFHGMGKGARERADDGAVRRAEAPAGKGFGARGGLRISCWARCKTVAGMK